jgi:hypothetical protein
MTRDEAEREAARLNEDHPDRTRFRWFVRETDGEWTVVKAPGAVVRPRLTNTSEPAPNAPPPAPPTEPRREWGFG